MQTPVDSIKRPDTPRRFRTVTAVLFSAALLLSNFSGASPSLATEEERSAEPSASAIVEEPRQESSTPTTTATPSQSNGSAEPKASATSDDSATEEASPSQSAEPTPSSTPDITEAKLTVRIAGGLSGVHLRLHTGSANASSAPVQEAWARCVSNSAGVCTFTVPDTHDADEDYEAGENYDRRFWVVQESAPSGWYLNKTLGLNGNSTAPYEFSTGPELRAGQTYSSGEFQLSRNNPSTALDCRPGVDIAVVLDRTGSAGTSAAAAMQDAVAGSKSSVTIYDGVRSLAQGLQRAAGSGHDVVIVATAGSSGSAGFTATEQAVAAANALKAQGSRVVAVGVGASNQANLRAISGAQSSGSATYSGADYHALGKGQLAGFLQSIAQQVSCETTIAVTQKTQAYDQDSAGAGGSGWKFELAAPGATPQPDAVQTTGDNGKVEYSLDFDSTTQGPVEVSLKGLLSDEQTAAGWAVKQLSCTTNGSSIDVNAPTAKFSVAAGDQVQCTFVNAQTLTPEMSVKKRAWDTPSAAGLSDAQRLESGHSLPAGHQVTWTYEVKNTGETVLHDITVVDDQLPEDAVSCPDTTLRVGKTMTCTASGKVTAKP